MLALDAKIVIDDNELFWRPDLGVLRDDSAEEPSEAAARRANLTFIKLDGNVGCVVNGAGLAMATMDLVKYYGGEPANFLDIGGSSSPEKVINALKIITADPHVKAILFNIFGGITRTDDVANGIVAATSQFKVNVPIVIRLTGTNEAEAIRILKGVGMRALSDMDQAVRAGGRSSRGGRHEHLRRPRTPGWSCRASPAARARSTRGRCSSTARRSSAGVTPGKGGQTFEGKVPVFNTVARGGARHRRQYLGHLRAADGRRRRDLRGGRRGLRSSLHHRGHPGHAHEPRHALRAGAAASRLIGPNCPGLITPGARAKVGIIPGNICTPGRVGLVSPQRDAHLRGGQPPHPRRHRPEHLRRHRRRSDHRHQLHRLPRAPSRTTPRPTPSS